MFSFARWAVGCRISVKAPACGFASLRRNLLLSPWQSLDRSELVFRAVVAFHALMCVRARNEVRSAAVGVITAQHPADQVFLARKR